MEKIKHICVIVQLDNGKAHQVFLTAEQEKAVASVLAMEEPVKLNEQCIDALEFVKP